MIPSIKMLAGQTNDHLDEDQESVPPRKKRRMAPQQTDEANEMAMDVQQPMLGREEQAINHFDRTTDEIMVIII